MFRLDYPKFCNVCISITTKKEFNSCFLLQTRNARILNASNDLEAGKINVNIFLNRVSHRNNKLMPETAYNLSESPELNAEDDIQSQSELSAPLASSSQGVLNKCLVCMEHPLQILLLPCKHISLCSECWPRIEREEKQRIEELHQVNYSQMEHQASVDQSFEIPIEFLPKCPLCRQGVRNSMEIFM